MKCKRKGGNKPNRFSSESWSLNKKQKYCNLTLNPLLDDSTEEFRKCWQQKKAFTKSQAGKEVEVELYDSPFQLCCIKNFIIDSEPFLEELKDELSDLEYTTKNNDLYQFHQSKDLASIDTPAVVSIREFLYQNVVGWVREATGLPLTDKVDATCSRYDHTDVLLCHDDKCEGRKIAFILYLSKNWEKADGGWLDMFDRDENEQPKSVERSLVPTWNSFVFFEVTDKSFHQVSEILTEDKTRVSLSGWFHAPTELPLTVYSEPSINYHQPLESDVDLAKWISIQYLMDETHRDINKVFEENSEIRLDNFFRTNKFAEVAEALRISDIQWSFRGPANRRRYERAVIPPLALDPPAQPECLWEMVELLQSQQMFELMAAMTDLDLSDVDPVKGSPMFHLEVQRWSPGCYTLMHSETAPKTSCLEAIIHFNCDSLTNETGGFTSYIAKDEDEELLTIMPTANSLALTYRGEDTLNFVKYINQRYQSMFHTISITYFERPSATPST